MIGLLYLVFFVAYIGLSVWLVKLSLKAAKKRGVAGWKYAVPSAFVLYMLVFWDWIPTMVTHQYYCATEGGFTVYKTLDEWGKENPGVLEGLEYDNSSVSKYEEYDDGHGKVNTYHVNERIHWFVSQQDISSLFPIIRTERRMVDIGKNETLALYINFSSGNSVKKSNVLQWPLKFWLDSPYCLGGRDEAISSSVHFNLFKGVER